MFKELLWQEYTTWRCDDKDTNLMRLMSTLQDFVEDSLLTRNIFRDKAMPFIAMSNETKMKVLVDW